MTELLYQTDPLVLMFDGTVTEVFPLPSGQYALILQATYFYPTGGGQEHDTGRIGTLAVVDVIKDEQGKILHVVDGYLEPGTYPACIDEERRLRAMQHHTGQHVLSAVFLHELGMESVSASIKAYRPSTIDLDTREVNLQDLEHVEHLANRLIFENRQVKSYYVTDVDVPTIPFRKAPKVSGRIRVVEVDGYDYTPCGGTHCLWTGMIGMLKIIRSETINRKIRIHFVAGFQALSFFQSNLAVIQALGQSLNTRPEDMVQAVNNLKEQEVRERMALASCQQQMERNEAAAITISARKVGEITMVVRLYADRQASELRSLASRVVDDLDLAVLATHNGDKLSVVVAVKPSSGLKASVILNDILDPLGCRGGGDENLAQGGGIANPGSEDDLVERVTQWILLRH